MVQVHAIKPKQGDIFVTALIIHPALDTLSLLAAAAAVRG